MITAENFHTIPFKPYPEIKLAVLEKGRTRKSPIRLSQSIGGILEELKPDYIHIATAAEGTLGPSTVNFCKQHGLSYTTEMHSRLPEYVAAYVAKFGGKHSRPPAEKMVYAWMRSRHNGALRTLVPSESMRE
jgi:hypothetical protein